MRLREARHPPWRLVPNRAADGAGKNVAKLRRWSEAWGCGLALCRLEALQEDAPLERDDEGSGLLLPHRPSWWPERIK